MRRVLSLYRSSVGKKILMALTGMALVVFVIGHMVGNLKVLQGPEAFNGYAEWLREVGYPAIPHHGALWAARLGLLAAVLVHVVAAVQLWSSSRAARPVRYRAMRDLSFSYASRTMRWGGVIIALFVVYHILHFTTGQAHTDFVAGDPYHNFVVAFRNPLVLAVYAVAQAALCLHLYHGVWSVTQTLGADSPRIEAWRRPVALGAALVVFGGFLLPPFLVLSGVVG